jgi:putative tryptophan/tyrosine transport system substrate-binding protein
MQPHRLRRREFITLLGGAAIAWPLAVQAQQPQRTRRIGMLMNFGADDREAQGRLAAFKQRLRELGWSEGQNLQTEVRFAGTNVEHVRSSANELVGLAPDAIISSTSTTTRALLDVTSNIPILAAVSGDPVALGFTKSLSHPTGNVTGFTTFNDTLAGKKLEILRESVPAMRKVALLWVPVNPQQMLLETLTKKAAETRGIALVSLPVKTADEILPALKMAQSEGAVALVVAADPLTTANARTIIEGCRALNLPSIHTFTFEARNGALMSYGIDLVENYRRTAEYADRIFRGAKITDLPFQEPTRFTLSINLKTAHSMGITMPPNVLAVADEVIE